MPLHKHAVALSSAYLAQLAQNIQVAGPHSSRHATAAAIPGWVIGRALETGVEKNCSLLVKWRKNNANIQPTCSFFSQRLPFHQAK